MKVLYNLFFFVAVIITGRAHELPERTHRGLSSSEIGESNGDYSLQRPSSFSFGGSNEAGELFGAETNMVNGYDTMGPYYALDEYDLVPPAGGFGNGNLFRAAAHASASAESNSGETTQNDRVVQADTMTQAELQAQFRQKAEYGAEAQADAIFQEKKIVQLGEGTKRQTSSQGIITETIPGTSLNQDFKGLVISPLGYGNNNTKINAYKGSLAGPSWVAEPLNKPGQGPGSVSPGQTRLPPKHLSDAYGGDNSVIAIPQYGKDEGVRYNDGLPDLQYAQPIPQGIPITDTGIEKNKQKHKNVVSPNGYNYNKHWSIYTKPAEGESLVQVDEEHQMSGQAEANILSQGNDRLEYQKQAHANAVLQTKKGVDIGAANAETKKYSGYRGQYNAESQPDTMLPKQFTSTAHGNAEIQTNVAFPYRTSQHHGGAYFKKGSAAVQPSNVIETRLGKKNKSPRMLGFGYRHPHNGWYHG